MYQETFHHVLPDGQPAKFTIRDKIINGKRYFYANVVGTNLDFYTKLTAHEKELYFGVEVTNGRQQTVFYTDPADLKTDIKTHYGNKWLESEI